MNSERKPPKLRVKDGCYIANIYKDDGKRTTISFGPAGLRTEGQIRTAFEQWVDLFQKHPSKTLSYDNPYDALARFTNPSQVKTVGDLYDTYRVWAEQNMPPLRDGQRSPEFLQAERIGRFIEPYRQEKVGDFGPDELRKIQEAMVAYRYTRSQPKKTKEKPELVQYTRNSINRLVSQIRKMWRWAHDRDIVPRSSSQQLKEVRPLRIGQSAAAEKLKRSMVTGKEFEVVTANVTGVIADMLRLIWITAMRPSEVCRMRPFDILHEDKSCWLYVPGRDAGLVGDHKTAHFQRIRAIPLPSKAQAILKPRVTDFKSKDCIFSPVEAVRELLDRKAANRKTPLKYGNSPGTNRKEHPMIVLGSEYNSQTFNVAVRRACIRAGVERFTPYDLRRTAVTRIRSQLSRDAAKLILGHVSSDTTDLYLLEEVQEAVKVAKQFDAHGG